VALGPEPAVFQQQTDRACEFETVTQALEFHQHGLHLRSELRRRAADGQAVGALRQHQLALLASRVAQFDGASQVVQPFRLLAERQLGLARGAGSPS